MKILNENFEVGDYVEVHYKERRLPSPDLVNMVGTISEFFNFDDGSKGMYLTISKGLSFVPIIELAEISRINKRILKDNK